jgi:GPH family glycoside/pentoside/hexuronide:cation symporter
MQAGVYFSLLTLTEKIGLALAVGIPFVILPALGFEPRGEKTAEGIQALVLIFALAPAILHLSAAFILWRFPLGRLRQQELREKLTEKFGPS